MAKLTTTDITSGYALNTVYNANLDAIEAAMEVTLSRDGTAPNTMSAELDMNSNKITNLATPTAGADGCTKTYADGVSASAVTSINSLPDVTITGTPADNEVLAWDTASLEWINQTVAEVDHEVVDDLTPQLGGNLDAQSKDITTLASLTMDTTLTIQDAANTDSLAFSHDGTDFNIVGTTTTDINLSGVTALAAPAVNADFAAITATSYGGINEANLLDKSAHESVSGTYTFTGLSAAQPSLELSSTLPIKLLDETDAAADERMWWEFAVAGQLAFKTSTDARGGFVSWLTVDRTGTTVDTITLAGTSIVNTGALTATSYGGITEANLLDKTAAESISASYTWLDNTKLRFGSGADITIQWDTVDLEIEGLTSGRVINFRDAMVLKVWDAGDTDNIAISHDGTDCNFNFTNTTDLDIEDVTNVRFRGPNAYIMGGTFRIFDDGGTDYMTMEHDGTDLNWNHTNTADWQVIGLTDLNLRDGCGLQIMDAGDTDFVNMSHDGTDFNVAGTNTTDINFTGMGADFSGQVRCLANATGGASGYTLYVGADTCQIAMDDTDAIADRGLWNWFNNGGLLTLRTLTDAGGAGQSVVDFNRTATTVCSSMDVVGGTDLWVRDGANLRVYDAGDTDYMAMAHTGTNFTMTGTNTTRIDIGGITTLDLFDGCDLRIRDAGDTDYAVFEHDGTDFNITGTNTAEVNLLGVAGGLKIWDSGNTDYISIAHDDTDANIVVANTTDINVVALTGAFWLRDGAALKISDSTDADSVRMAHDGTDFTITSVNTTDWNIVDVTSNIRIRDGAQLLIGDTGDTDWIGIAHDGTDVNIVGTNTTDINITGATTLKMAGSISMVEQAAAPADALTYGQLWVKNDNPNILMYTDGDGTDFVVTVV